MVHELTHALRIFLERCVRPFFPFLEPLARPLRTDSRQDFLLGVLAAGVSVQEVVNHLKTQGFEHAFYAWIDDGQCASLRKMDGVAFQYHVRTFNDGEVRGHYEYAPEYAPIKHLRRLNRESRVAIFQTILESHIAPCTHPMFLRKRDFALEHV